MNAKLSLAILVALSAPVLAQQDQQPDRAKIVPPGPTRPFNAPRVEESQLSNGVKLALAEMHRLPIVGVTISLPYAGAAHDTTAQTGLSGLVTKLMMEGAGGMDGRAFAEALDDAGVALGIDLSDDAMQVTVFATKESLDKGMELAAKMIRQPALPQADFDRLKQQSLLGLEQRRGDPGSMARERLASRIYGDHPYGTAVTESSLGSLRLSDVQSFAANRLRPEGLTVSAAGDIAPQEFEAMVAKHFGDWRSQPGAALPAAVPAVAAAQPAHGLVIDVVDMPGSEQSAIRLGEVQIARNSPDYYAVSVMNQILGGFPIISRIGKNLREQHQWAYSPHLRGVSEQAGGNYMVDADVQTDATAPALQEIVKELRRMQDELVPDAELTTAKHLMTAEYVLSSQKVQDVAGRVAAIELNGLPADQMAIYRDRVNAVTPQDVQAAARAHLNPDAVQVVISGDAAKIVPGLQAIAAQVRVFDVQGKPETPAAAPGAASGAGR